jgi:hypothetical protein
MTTSLVETKEIHVGEESFDALWDVVAVDLIKDEADVRLDGWWSLFDEHDEEVNRVGVDPSALVLLGREDSLDDVSG